MNRRTFIVGLGAVATAAASTVPATDLISANRAGYWLANVRIALMQGEKLISEKVFVPGGAIHIDLRDGDFTIEVEPKHLPNNLILTALEAGGGVDLAFFSDTVDGGRTWALRIPVDRPINIGDNVWLKANTSS